MTNLTLIYSYYLCSKVDVSFYCVYIIYIYIYTCTAYDTIILNISTVAYNEIE